MDVDTIAYYSTPGPVTALPGPFQLPGDVSDLRAVVQGLVLHEGLAGLYGLPRLRDTHAAEKQVRTASAMVDRIRQIDSGPLESPRAPADRVVGVCRHFVVLHVALLRAAVIPARARVGFAGYFQPGWWLDHWITEVWRPEEGAWVRCDPQVDELQRRAFRIDFDPARLPIGAFLSRPEAWRACREDRADASRFGVAGTDNWGLAEVSGNAVRDLAALNKAEMLPWDEWGDMAAAYRSGTAADYDRLIDRLADVVVTADLSEMRDLYGSEDRLGVATELLR